MPSAPSCPSSRTTSIGNCSWWSQSRARGLTFSSQKARREACSARWLSGSSKSIRPWVLAQVLRRRQVVLARVDAAHLGDRPLGDPEEADRAQRRVHPPGGDAVVLVVGAGVVAVVVPRVQDQVVPLEEPHHRAHLLLVRPLVELV